MKHLIRTLLVAVALLAAASASAQAQMNAALGKPLPSSDLANGTVTVRVVKGSLTDPMVGIDVTLVAGDGAAKTARTDAEGRATFPAVTAGSTVTAKVEVEDGSAASEPFVVPAQGGVRLILSPVAWKDEGGSPAAPMAGQGGMPDARKLSGFARPEQADPAGQLTVRLVRGTMSEAIGGVEIALVGYHADGTVRTLRQTTDAGGRAVFDGLDPRGAETYYAMAVVPKTPSPTADPPAAPSFDRLRSGPISMMPGVGLRVLLAATKDSEAAIDDLGRIEDQVEGQAGTVRVKLRGAITEGTKVTLRSIDSGKVLATTEATKPQPSAATVRGAADKFIADPRMPDGVISIIVVRKEATGSTPTPIPGVTVEAADAEGKVLASLQTTDNGLATFGGLPTAAGTKIVFKVNVFGKELSSAALELPAEGGGRLSFSTSWGTEGELEAVFAGVAKSLGAASVDATVTDDKIQVKASPGRGELETLVAELDSKAQIYRSAPFQLAGRAAAVGILVFPRIVFRFHLGGQIDDAYMGFQGTMAIQNWSYAPYDPGPEGMLIPLPKGFIGAGVGEEATNKVGKDPQRGFIWRLPVPPGGADFTAGFSMPVDDGVMSWDMALPFGAFDSNLTMLHTPGMRVELPPGVNGRLATSRSGSPIFAVDGITIVPNQRMVMTVRGLPHQPAWHRSIRIAVGLVVTLFFILTIVVLIVWRRNQAVHVAAHVAREGVLDKLVALEKEHADGSITDMAYDQRKLKLRNELDQMRRHKARG